MLEGKVALLTGASGGIGSKIALTLAKEGVSLILSGTRGPLLGDLAKQIEDSGGIKPIVRVGSLVDPKVIDQLIGDDIDILINNAGLARDSLLVRMKDEAWDEVIQVNLTSVFKLCRSLVKGMIKKRFGRIVNMASVVGITGNVGQTNYCASKAGMIGFSKALALEVASRSITVNCIAPGFIETPMTSDLPKEAFEAIMKKIPIGRMGTPDDIARGVIFLLNSPYITGQTLSINGGMI